MVIEFNMANKPYEDVDVDMVTPKKSKQFQIITHGQTLNNKTRKNSSTKTVWQYERSTVYGDNSRESEGRQNTCYT